MKLLGKLICALTRKHKRGKVIRDMPANGSLPGERGFQCPRCGARWSRKVKANAN